MVQSSASPIIAIYSGDRFCKLVSIFSIIK